MKKVQVFQDGKVCRNVDGTILRRRGKQVQIEFVVSDFDEDDNYLPVTVIRWFKKRRRDNGGVYECYDMNYWYYENLDDCAKEIIARN